MSHISQVLNQHPSKSWVIKYVFYRTLDSAFSVLLLISCHPEPKEDCINCDLPLLAWPANDLVALMPSLDCGLYLYSVWGVVVWRGCLWLPMLDSSYADTIHIIKAHTKLDVVLSTSSALITCNYYAEQQADGFCSGQTVCLLHGS